MTQNGLVTPLVQELKKNVNHDKYVNCSKEHMEMIVNSVTSSIRKGWREIEQQQQHMHWPGPGEQQRGTHSGVGEGGVGFVEGGFMLLVEVKTGEFFPQSDFPQSEDPLNTCQIN